MEDVAAVLVDVRSKKLGDNVTTEEVIHIVERVFEVKKYPQNVYIEVLRSLRNFCANSSFGSALISRNKIWINLCNLFIENMERYEFEACCNDEDVIVLLRVCIQFFGNLASSTSAFKSQIWNLVLPKLRSLLCRNDRKLASYSAMLSYNCLLENGKFDEWRLEQFFASEDIIDIVQSFALMATNEESEFSLFILRRIFLTKFYASFLPQVRLIILDVFLETVEKLSDSPSEELLSNLTVVSERLQRDFEAILNPLSPDFGSVPQFQNVTEVCRCLELMCESSANKHTRNHIASDFKLLEACIHVLRMLTQVGKSKEPNAFSPDQSLHSFKEGTARPTDGFRKDIVRFIANVVYENTANQNKVRELDGIYLILDNCSLDSHNPYITQWCVFAICNLCKNNEENQKVIAEIQSRGKVLPSQILEEFKIKVVPK